MSLNDLSSNKKSYSKTGVGLYAFSLRPIKAFKNFLLVFLVNTNAMVLYTDRYIVFFRLTDSNIYLICVWRILNGVIQQIDNYLPNSIFICADRGVVVMI